MMGTQAKLNEEVRRGKGKSTSNNKYNPTKPSSKAKSFTPDQWRRELMKRRHEAS